MPDLFTDRYTNLLPEDGEVYLFPGVFAAVAGLQLYNELLLSVVWQQEPIKMFGKEVMQPRLTAWYGDAGKSYSYSGITMHPHGWIPPLTTIKDSVEAIAGTRFNSALLNLYRNGQDSMGWHRDNEKELGMNPVICSVSLGATRTFQLRHCNKPGLRLSLPLSHGSVLLMRGATQHHWQHAVPKQKNIQASRINITFRVVC